jgi:hypothetical protein
VTTIGTPKENRELGLDGTFFCQQNQVNHCCAHAALRMVLNTSGQLLQSSGTLAHTKVTNELLNQALHNEGVPYDENKGLEQFKN